MPREKNEKFQIKLFRDEANCVDDLEADIYKFFYVVFSYQFKSEVMTS